MGSRRYVWRWRMITVDKSLGKPWRSQRDNTWKPHGSCNVTSYRMAADVAGIKCPGDEDLFLAFMNEPRWWQEIGLRFPWAWEEVVDPARPTHNKINYIYPPEQIHDLLAEGFNEWTGTKAARFELCVSRKTLMQAILAGAGVVLSGKFPYRGGRSINHIVALSGFDTLQAEINVCAPKDVDPYRVSAWIIDDPYGDYRTEYENHDGNGVRMPQEDFDAFIRGAGVDCNWSHIVEAGS